MLLADCSCSLGLISCDTRLGFKSPLSLAPFRSKVDAIMVNRSESLKSLRGIHLTPPV